MINRPRIAITTRLEMETRRFYLGRDYSECVFDSGGVPFHLGLIADAEYVRGALAEADGVLLPGSNTDVDPARYGQEPHPKLGTVIPEKDLTDLLILEEAERLGLPIFGICFGMQVLNVSRGGALVQDIPAIVDDCIKHDQGTPYDRNSHSITVEPGSVLGRVALGSRDQVRVNSSHHQALSTLGANLRATAWAPDGVIECIEDVRPERPVLGVQWHPEMTYKSDQLSRSLFGWFVRECSDHAARMNKVRRAAVS